MALIEATEVDATTGNADNSLPDPTRKARLLLFALLVLAFVIAVVMNWQEWTGEPFEPAEAEGVDFALFAGFYVAAQVIERLMLFVSPFVVFWTPHKPDASDAVRAAHVKADRGVAVLGVATVFGVAASCGFGLFFLRTIGMHVTPTIDTFFTGLVIAAGTKPLHDFIGYLQKQNAPTTGTSTDTGTADAAKVANA